MCRKTVSFRMLVCDPCSEDLVIDPYFVTPFEDAALPDKICRPPDSSIRDHFSITCRFIHISARARYLFVYEREKSRYVISNSRMEQLGDGAKSLAKHVEAQ